jgi:hypothetical protein
MDYHAAAVDLAEHWNLKILTKRNSAGQVINYRVYRAMPDRLVFLASRSNDKPLLKVIEHYAGVPA